LNQSISLLIVLPSAFRYQLVIHPVTEDNFDIASVTLSRRYKNQRLLATAYVREFSVVLVVLGHTVNTF
jgi:hypothetical protein